MNMRSGARCVAVLGPTNTGKTHYAIERMLAHRTGVIGLPLRLLAREVYDRIKAIRGLDCVALVTGEERIVPDRTQYWVCTVEAMPLEIGADFVAIDEIQLCADPDRGHVFTDRLLHARGLHETLFMGSDTMRQAIAGLVPGVQFQRRERMSQLTYSGSKKISRMPPRSAIVGFSVENVYAIAELIRRQKGGCAVVMGALSPRTRNAQVELYQNGDVDYLVATDAIGMGLNLDIKHVAFSATVKFDGRRMRPLNPDELAQIAGRAGRYQSNGSFGVTGEARPLADEVIAAIENHEFLPVRKLHWRNARMDFTSSARLIASLEAPTSNDWLTRARDADDVVALKTLTAQPEIIDRLRDGRDLRLLWDVCRIPDFRGISATEHAGLLARVFEFLQGDGRIAPDWLARNIARIDRTDGDIDTLSKRLAYIRTWTYIAQRAAWVDDENHWRGATRAVEDRLSDALHDRLTQRFVDRRTSVLMRRLKQKESLVAEVNDKGEVTVEGQLIGKLEGFRFRQDATATPEEARMLRQASVAALVPVFHLRADKFYNAADPEFRIKPRFAPWVDIMTRWHGPIARHWQFLFAADWMAEDGDDLTALLTAPLPEPQGDIVAQGIGTGPTVAYGAMPSCFAALIHAARRTLTITTPYFVPGEQVLSALMAAARRGVETTLVVPHRNDSRFVGAASRSHYPALLEAGVEIHEFVPGLLHAKTMVVDESAAIVGSANFDKLSLRINQETNLATSDPGFVRRIEQELFEVDFARAREWTEKKPAGWSDYLAKFFADQL
jgi:ATP-dependent RNA helicase SUPV3L1/SUV3